MRTLVFLGLVLALPLVELYLLIALGARVGALPTLALCVLTAVAGVVLVRAQGLGVIARVSDALAREEAPARPLLEGALLLLAGMLLLFPGLLTDLAGFLLLVPAVRRALIDALLRRRGRRGPPGAGQVYEAGEGSYRVVDVEVIERDRREEP